MKDEVNRIDQEHSHNATQPQGKNQEVCSPSHQTLLSTTATSRRSGSGFADTQLWYVCGRALSGSLPSSKVEGALQELDETAYWLELLGEAEILAFTRLQALHNEAEELIAILVTIVTKVKRKGLRKARRI